MCAMAIAAASTRNVERLLALQERTLCAMAIAAASTRNVERLLAL